MNKTHFLSLVFNQPRCHGNSTQPSQNARINTSVINLDSCKKQAPKHKQFKSYGELGKGTWKLCSATLSQQSPNLSLHSAKRRHDMIESDSILWTNEKISHYVFTNSPLLIYLSLCRLVVHLYLDWKADLFFITLGQSFTFSAICM